MFVTSENDFWRAWSLRMKAHTARLKPISGIIWIARGNYFYALRIIPGAVRGMRWSVGVTMIGKRRIIIFKP